MGFNAFIALPPIAAGAAGPQVPVDLNVDVPPTGLSPHLTFICVGDFADGYIAIEGSPDGITYDVLVQFSAGSDSDGHPGPRLEFSPLTCDATVRFIRANVAATVRDVTNISVAGEQNCDCSSGGGVRAPLPDRTMIVSATLPPGADPTRWFTVINDAIEAALIYPWPSGPVYEENPAHVWVAELGNSSFQDIVLRTGVYVSAMPQDTVIAVPSLTPAASTTNSDLINVAAVIYTPTGDAEETTKCIGFKALLGVTFDTSGKTGGRARLVFSGTSTTANPIITGEGIQATFDGSGVFAAFDVTSGETGGFDINLAPTTSVIEPCTLRGNGSNSKKQFNALSCILGGLTVGDAAGGTTGPSGIVANVQKAWNVGNSISVGGSGATLNGDNAELNGPVSIVGGANAFLAHAATGSLTIDSGSVTGHHLAVTGDLTVLDDALTGAGEIDGSHITVSGNLQIGNDTAVPGSFGEAYMPHFRVGAYLDVLGSSILHGDHGTCNRLRNVINGAELRSDDLTVLDRDQAINIGIAVARVTARNICFHGRGGTIAIGIFGGDVIVDMDGARFEAPNSIDVTVFDNGARLSMRGATKGETTGILTRFRNLGSAASGALIDLRGARIAQGAPSTVSLVGPGPIDRDYAYINVQSVPFAVDVGPQTASLVIDPPFPDNVTPTAGYVVSWECDTVGVSPSVTAKTPSGFDFNIGPTAVPLAFILAATRIDGI